MRWILGLTVLALLAGCATGAPKPMLPTGDWVQLNNWPGWQSWTPTQAELQALPR